MATDIIYSYQAIRLIKGNVMNGMKLVKNYKGHYRFKMKFENQLSQSFVMDDFGNLVEVNNFCGFQSYTYFVKGD